MRVLHPSRITRLFHELKPHWFVFILSTAFLFACTEDTKEFHVPDADADIEETTSELDDDHYDLQDIEPVNVVIQEGCNPFATSDECILPIPSSYYEIEDETTSTGVRGNYPLDSLKNEDGDKYFDISSANRSDGYSPAGPILLHMGYDIHEDFLSDQHGLADTIEEDAPIALFDWDSGERIAIMSEMDMNRERIEDYPDRYALIVRPLEPLEMGHRHIIVFRDGITDTEGVPVPCPVAFEALRDGIPTTNEWIESSRGHYNQLFDFLDENGYSRNEILLAWDYMVASKDWLLGSVLSMRETAFEEMEGTGLGYTINEDETKDDISDNIARIVIGEFEVPTFINEDSIFDYDENNRPIRQTENLSFPFAMLIPKVALERKEPLPLILFGHGIFGDGVGYLKNWPGPQYIQPLAQQNEAVIVATDWIGLSKNDYNVIVSQVVPDINNIGLITDRLQQSLINNLTLIELTLGTLQYDDRVKIGDWDLLKTDEVLYYGVSLGGIQGSSLVSISNRITRAVLAVPGSVWSNMLPRSTVWNSIKTFFDLQYPDPLVQQMGQAFVQTRFDHSDPINLTRLMFKDPLEDAPEERRVILQEAIGDSQVPNMTTEMLARGMGVKLLTPSVYEVYGLETVETPEGGSVMSQVHMVEQSQDPFPPNTNVPASADNGVHTDVCLLPHVLDQTKTFLNLGEIVQYCNGACDPD